MPDNSVGPDPRQRLRDIHLFASEHGWNALTGSDALWLTNEVERLHGLIRTAHDNADYIADHLRSDERWSGLVAKAEGIKALEEQALTGRKNS